MALKGDGRVNVLSELHIENFAVIADARLKLEPGLTILSGEEGAGKSLVADALEALMGAKMGSAVVRTGTASAHVEGIFQLDAALRERLADLFAGAEISPDADGTLILSREIHENGRSPARINRRAVPLALLKQFGTALLDLHSQLDYLSLLDTARQRDLVDRFGKLEDMKHGVTVGVDRLREMKREIKATRERPQDRSGDFLSYQLNEIDSAEITDGEDETLGQERETLRQADTIKEGCHLAYGELYGGDDAAVSHIYQALAGLREAARADAALEPQVSRLETLAAEAEDSARELLGHGEALAADGARLEEIEQRLHLIGSLKRKYGNSVTDVLEAADRMRTELEQITDGEQYLTGLAARVATLEAEVGAEAGALSEARTTQAAALTELVNRELADVGLPDVTFGITLAREAAEDGLPLDGARYAYTRDGVDRLVFTVATNPGEPMRPLAEIASGGETSRIVLATKSALKRADPVPTLVFDEIDMGVGARSGDSVGRKLADLAEYHQVICITHLPQIACFADTHFRLVKDTASGRAETTVDRIEGEARVAELAAMLGASSAGEVMTQGAGELIAQAAAWKQKQTKRGRGSGQTKLL
jgi:DNA repair protein RecN (Recombination protein N)